MSLGSGGDGKGFIFARVEHFDLADHGRLP